MKKNLIGAVIIAVALILGGCANDSADSKTDEPTADEPTAIVGTDGVVDLTQLTSYGYDSTAGGLVHEFDASVTTQYAEAFLINFTDLGDVSAYTTVTVLADVYTADGKVNLSSTWGDRLSVAATTNISDWYGDSGANVIKTNYNMGVSDQSLTWSSTDGVVGLEIQRKDTAVTKIVITGITFSK
jgi:hypothetical protein